MKRYKSGQGWSTPKFRRRQVNNHPEFPEANTDAVRQAWLRLEGCSPEMMKWKATQAQIREVEKRDNPRGSYLSEIHAAQRQQTHFATKLAQRRPSLEDVKQFFENEAAKKGAPLFVGEAIEAELKRQQGLGILEELDALGNLHLWVNNGGNLELEFTPEQKKEYVEYSRKKRSWKDPSKLTLSLGTRLAVEAEKLRHLDKGIGKRYIIALAIANTLKAIHEERKAATRASLGRK